MTFIPAYTSYFWLQRPAMSESGLKLRWEVCCQTRILQQFRAESTQREETYWKICLDDMVALSRWDIYIYTIQCVLIDVYYIYVYCNMLLYIIEYIYSDIYIYIFYIIYWYIIHTYIPTNIHIHIHIHIHIYIYIHIHTYTHTRTHTHTHRHTYIHRYIRIALMPSTSLTEHPSLRPQIFHQQGLSVTRSSARVLVCPKTWSRSGGTCWRIVA